MKNLIKFLVLNSEDILLNQIKSSVAKSIDSGVYVLGPRKADFETAFANYCDVRHCVGVGNGLDAITISLRALGIGPGDEVIVPSYTFVATWLAVTSVGARLVPIDVRSDTCNIDEAILENKISKNTKAIIVVHLYGQMAEMTKIMQIADRYKVPVIEDAAQAHGALNYGKPPGSASTCATFSFYPGKNLGAFGDAGCIITNNDRFSDATRAISNYGSVVKYQHDLEGLNSRLDELQAVVLLEKLRYLDVSNRVRETQAQYYIDNINNDNIILPTRLPHNKHSWHLFTVRTSSRDDLKYKLSELGIETLIHYPVPLNEQMCFRRYNLDPADFARAKEIAESTLSLPLGIHLTEQELKYVVDCINGFR